MLAASLRSQNRSGAGTGNKPGDEVGGRALAPTAHLWLDVPSFQLWQEVSGTTLSPYGM